MKDSTSEDGHNRLTGGWRRHFWLASRAKRFSQACCKMRSLALTDKISLISTKQSYVRNDRLHESKPMSLKRLGTPYRLDCSAAPRDFAPLSALSQYVSSFRKWRYEANNSMDQICCTTRSHLGLWWIQSHRRLRMSLLSPQSLWTLLEGTYLLIIQQGLLDPHVAEHSWRRSDTFD